MPLTRRMGDGYLRTTACGPPWVGRTRIAASDLADRLVRAVGLDLVDPELATLEVAVLRERDGEAEERLSLRDRRRGDVLPNLRAGDLAVCAGLGDSLHRDGCRNARRGAEELAVTAVGLLERGHLRRLRVHGEEGVVRTGDLEGRRIEETVRAEELCALAGRLELLPEALRLGGQLPRDVDVLHAAADLRDLRRVVGSRLADRVAVDRDSLRLEVVLHRVGEALGVRLLVIDDVHVVRVQLVDEVGADRRALDAVVRDDAEEVALPCAVGQRRA